MKKLFENAGHMGKSSPSPHTPYPIKDNFNSGVEWNMDCRLNNTVGNKQLLSSPNPFPQGQAGNSTTNASEVFAEDPISIPSILELGFEELNIPKWYSFCWFNKMKSKGWRIRGGDTVSAANWRKVLQSFWLRAGENEKRHCQVEYAAFLANQNAVEQLPPIKVTRVHWHECQRTCANFKKGKCICGYRTPAFMEPACHGCTERCLHFSPLPWAWQQAWMFSFWETWKNTQKGLALAAYFAEHPDELEEAKWRNDAFEPTEKDCFEANRRYNGYVWKPYPAGVRPL